MTIQNHPAAHYMTKTNLVLSTCKGMVYRKLYIPAKELLEWDGADVETTTHAAYSDHHNVFTPLEIKITGRKLRYTNGTWGIKCKARSTSGESYDREWFDGVLIQPGGDWTPEKFWLNK